MNKKVIVFVPVMLIFLTSLIFISGCSSINNADNETSDKSFEDEDASGSVASKNVNSNETISGDCQAGWICMSSTMMVYRNENCSFGEKKPCNTICTNDICAPAKVCSPGFKCLNDQKIGYQLEDCSWIKEQNCDFGCDNGDCKPMPEGYNESNITSSSSSSENTSNTVTTPVITEIMLKIGEEHQVGGKTLKIYNIESDRAVLLVNGSKTNWLIAGEKVAVGTAQITIKEILFQSYQGGIQAVSYVVG